MTKGQDPPMFKFKSLRDLEKSLRPLLGDHWIDVTHAQDIAGLTPPEGAQRELRRITGYEPVT